jgi:hypothetical protein
MLLIEHLQTDSETGADASHDVRLRVHGGTRDLEMIPLVAGNHAIGSGPKCSVRLRDAGVGPMHGLITLDDRGARVRRWAGGTFLNGRTFVEETLLAGDRLSVGPIDLEIIGTESLAESWDEVSPASDGEDVAGEMTDDEQPAVVDAAPVEVAVEKSLDGFQASVETLDANDEVPTAAEARTAKRSAGRKLRSALRRQRVEFERLLASVETLAERVESAIAERHEAADVASWDSATADWSGAAEPEPTAWLQERIEHAEQNAALEADLATTRQRLAEALAELEVAQASIEDLQKRLADSREMWRELSDERALWQRQLGDLETQLAELSAETQRLQDDPTAHKAVAVSERGEPAAVAEWPLDNIGENVAAAVQLDEVAGAFNSVALSETGGFETQSDATAEPESDSRSEGAWGFEDDVEAAGPDELRETDEPLEVDASAVFPFDRVGSGVEFAGDEAELAASSAMDATERRPDPVCDALKLFADSTCAAPKTETESAAQPTKNDAETPSDVGETMANLRELSLWRQTPESSESSSSGKSTAVEEAAVTDDEAMDSAGDAGSASSVADEPDAILTSQPEEAETAEPAVEVITGAKIPTDTAAQEVEVSTAPASTSFTDRYAHMFEQEASVERPQTLAPAVVQKEEPKPVRAAEPLVSSVSPVSSAATSTGDAEDSIEHYMARMMQRIRGDAAASGSSSGSQAVAASAVSNSGANQRTSNSATASVPSEAPSEQPLIRLEDLKSKVPTPEFATDMGALRALANQSARHAIGVHTARTLRGKALTRFIISLLAGTTSLYFMLDAPDWRSHEFSTACVALIASIYWGQLTFVSLLKAVRVGAFDEIETDFTPVDKSQPALPIDVARR